MIVTMLTIDLELGEIIKKGVNIMPNKYNCGCPMERALKPDQCAIMRDFLARAVQYAQNHAKVDVGVLLRNR
jgi:hypothetical protein